MGGGSKKPMGSGINPGILKKLRTELPAKMSFPSYAMVGAVSAAVLYATYTVMNKNRPDTPAKLPTEIGGPNSGMAKAPPNKLP
jgi:hypothetical protein